MSNTTITFEHPDEAEEQTANITSTLLSEENKQLARESEEQIKKIMNKKL